MKKSIIMIVTVLALSGLCGCSSAASSKAVETVLTPSNQENIENYYISGNPTFLPINCEHIKDGTPGVYIVEYVHTTDGTVWTSAGEINSSGYGYSFVEEFGPDGKPVLYDGDLNTLKAKYGVE